MTTIAYDGRYLAADTLALRNGNRSNIKCHKMRLVGAFAYAASGEWASIVGQVVKWHQEGAVPDDLPPYGGGSLTIVNTISGRVWAVAGPQMPYLDEEAAPYAVGTGGDIALGAMDAGATAMEAVAVAIKHDNCTGGDVEFIDMQHTDAGVQVWGPVPDRRADLPPLYRVTTAPDGAQDIQQVTEYLRREGDGADVWRLDVRGLLLDLDLSETDVQPLSQLYVSAATVDHPLPGLIYEYIEVRTGPWMTVEETRARMLSKLREAIGEVTERPATIHWRIRPEVGATYQHDTMQTEWYGYARFVVLPDAKPSIIIHKPRAPEKSATGGNLWADACSGRLVLGTGCGACLRCNREWFAVVREMVGEGVMRPFDQVTLNPEQVQAALGRAPITVTAQAVDNLLSDAAEGRNIALERLTSYVDEWNRASSVGDQHALRALDIALRNLTFPPGVELVDDFSTTQHRKRIVHIAKCDHGFSDVVGCMVCQNAAQSQA